MKNLTFDLTERVKQIIEYYGLNPYSMSVKISVSEGTIRKFLAGQIGMKVETLTKILTIFDEISPDWLILGKGEMLRENCKKAPNRPIQTEDESQASNVVEEQPSFSRPSPVHLSSDSNPSWERYNDALIEIGSLRERLASASATIAKLKQRLSTEGEKTNSTLEKTGMAITSA